MSRIFRFFKHLEGKGKFFYVKRLRAALYNYKLLKKVKGYLKRNSKQKLSAIQIEEIRSFYKNYGIKRPSVLWHEFYFNCNEIFSPHYIPENLFYLKIEPILNDYSYFPSLSDKNLLSKLFANFKQPETVIKNMNGFYYHSDRLISKAKAIEICDNQENLIIKPTVHTGGGKNVDLFNTENGFLKDKSVAISKLFEAYKTNYIVQKAVKQNEVMQRLNPTSLNTLRVMTFLRETQASVLSIIVRMGREGSIIDNSTIGGLSCGVQSDGALNAFGFQLQTGKRFVGNDHGLKFKDIVLPHMDKVKNFALELHKKAPQFRLVSWDLALDHLNEVVLVEYNVFGQDINFHQLNNGPCLAELLNEIKKPE